MAQLVRCKSCGFILAESALRDACPVCGVPRKMFEPFVDPVSARRRWILSLHIHPIVVHFTVSFTASALGASLFLLLFPEVLRQTVTAGLQIVAALLPLVLIISYVTGIYDARVRYRRARSRHLRQKMLFGVTLFCLSTAAAALLFAADPSAIWVRATDAALMAACTACAFFQGRIGGHLMEALFPG